MTRESVVQLFERWNEALQTGDPKQVVSLYHPEATLLPTVSNQVRHNHQEIEDYFVSFLQKQPSGVIEEANVRLFDDLAINSGVYTFSFGDGSQVTARYTYVYQQVDGQWLIIEHHSSMMPE